MTFLGITSIVCFLLVVAALWLPVGKAFLLLVLCAPLTTVAVFNLGENSVLVYHLIWAIVAIKVVVLRIKSGKRMKTPWLPFLVFCLASTLLALFNGDVLVVNIDARLANVAFSFQQYTQWAYLAMAISTAWFTTYLLDTGKIGTSDLLNWLDAGLVVVIVVAFLQLVVPAEILNEFIRNSVHTGYKSVGARLSSTFQEPSMLSLYLVPMMGMHVIRFAYQPNAKSAVLVLLSLVVCLMNNSSSAALGLIVLPVFVSVWLFVHANSARVSAIVFVAVCIVMVVLTVSASLGAFDNFVSTLLSKLGGEGVSGSIRSYNAALAADVFLGHPIIGVGWGTVRSEALLTTWLAELGLVGAVLFAKSLINLLRSLLSGSSENRRGGSVRFVASVSGDCVLHIADSMRRAVLPLAVDCARSRMVYRAFYGEGTARVCPDTNRMFGA